MTQHTLELVSGKPFSVPCYGCRCRIGAKEEKWADRSGPPYVAYYCRACKVGELPVEYRRTTA